MTYYLFNGNSSLTTFDNNDVLPACFRFVSRRFSHQTLEMCAEFSQHFGKSVGIPGTGEIFSGVNIGNGCMYVALVQ